MRLATRRGLWRLCNSMAAVRSSTTTTDSSGLCSHSHSVPSWSRAMGWAWGSSLGSVRTTVTRRVKRSARKASAPGATWNLATVWRVAAAWSAASTKMATSSGAREATTTHTLRVLHTLRSREWRTAAAKRAGSAAAVATIQAPPVPCRLTGMPAWRATAPSWATAGPEPRATAKAKRESEKSAHPAARAAASTSRTVPDGRSAASRAGVRAADTMALAVPRASLPMRNTTALPLRNTPQASANTLGRPSNTKPTTPSPARRCSTVKPCPLMVSTTVPRPEG